MQEAINLITTLWRIFLAICLFQLAGGLYALINPIHPDTVISVWCGGAYASPAGFLLGSLWQLKTRPHSFFENKEIFLILAAAAIVLPLAAYFHPDLNHF